MTVRRTIGDADLGPYAMSDLYELPESGKGFEPEDEWLVEVAAGFRHTGSRGASLASSRRHSVLRAGFGSRVSGGIVRDQGDGDGCRDRGQ